MMPLATWEEHTKMGAVSTTLPSEIPLSKGKVALIDAKDYELVSQFKWQYHYRGYAYSQTYLGGGRKNAKYKKIWMHRLITGCPEDKIVDHISRDKLDNRRSNLRICTQAQNQMNSKLRDTNSSGYRGVTKDKYGWIARIGINGKRVYLGWFMDKEEAAMAYDKAAKKQYGNFAKLNIQGEN